MADIHGLLPHNQTGYFYITLQESYVTMFQLSADRWYEQSAQDEEAQRKRDARYAHAVAKAYISDVLENLSDRVYKDKLSERDLWVFLSFPQLEARLHGGCKMRTLKEAMKELVEDGYVFKQKNRDPHFKALEYKMNLPKYRKELNALPKKHDSYTSADMHDELDDSANLHDDDANLHHENADMHDDSAKSHPRINTDITQNKHRENREIASHARTIPVTCALQTSAIAPSAHAHVSLSEQENFTAVSKITQETAPMAEKPKRKPTTSSKKTVEQERIARVFAVIDECWHKVKPGNPDFHVVQSQKAIKAVEALIAAHASPAILKMVFMDMWNDYRNGEYWWRGTGRMTIPAICEQYSSRAPKFSHVSLVPDGGNSPAPSPSAHASPLSLESSRPELKPFVPDMPLLPMWEDPKKKRRHPVLLAAQGGN